MIRKLFLFALLIATSNYTFSQVREITLVDKKDHCGPHNSCIPTVSTDGDDIIIKCDSTIYNVDVIISDQYGNVIHQSANMVGPTETIIHSHNNGDSEKTSIDLYYDDKHLKGYFE